MCGVCLIEMWCDVCDGILRRMGWNKRERVIMQDNMWRELWTWESGVSWLSFIWKSWAENDDPCTIFRALIPRNLSKFRPHLSNSVSTPPWSHVQFSIQHPSITPPPPENDESKTNSVAKAGYSSLVWTVSVRLWWILVWFVLCVHELIRGKCCWYRQKKVKCTGERPECLMCSRLRQICIYLPRVGVDSGHQVPSVGWVLFVWIIFRSTMPIMPITWLLSLSCPVPLINYLTHRPSHPVLSGSSRFIQQVLATPPYDSDRVW